MSPALNADGKTHGRVRSSDVTEILAGLNKEGNGK